VYIYAILSDFDFFFLMVANVDYSQHFKGFVNIKGKSLAFAPPIPPYLS